jgi:tripartite-type tricarboxylate transporter receptor subunit TctC
MTLVRRRFLQFAASAAASLPAIALPAMSGTVWADTYPSRPVRVVNGFSAGSSADICARLICQWLSEHMGQPFVVDNRPGAGSNIAADIVAKSPADGYTLLWATAANAISATLFPNLSFNLVRDIAPVAGAFRTPMIMVVNPKVPARTVPEFIAYAKANPGKLNMGSGGVGTVLHVAGELFKMMNGIDMIHVPYRGDGPALTDLLGGQVQVMFGTVPVLMDHIKAGTLRALAITTATRSDVLPNIPTVGEFVPGYEASGWQGFGAPRNTPADVIARINAAVNAALADKGIRARFDDLGGTPLVTTPAAFGTLMAEDTVKWGKVVTFAGIKTE